jgi:hypothetical protein
MIHDLNASFPLTKFPSLCCVDIIPPPQQYPRRRARTRRTAPAPTPPAGLTIVSVTISLVVDTQLILTFSGAVAWNGIDLPYAFQVFTHDGFMDGCIGVLAVGADWIELASIRARRGRWWGRWRGSRRWSRGRRRE